MVHGEIKIGRLKSRDPVSSLDLSLLPTHYFLAAKQTFHICISKLVNFSDKIAIPPPWLIFIKTETDEQREKLEDVKRLAERDGELHREISKQIGRWGDITRSMAIL